MLRDSPTEFGAVTKTLHWIMALAVLTMFALGLWASEMAESLLAPGATLDEDGAQRTALLFSLHKSLGILVLLAAILRLAWALGQRRPGLLQPGRVFEVFLARAVHALLYGCLLLAPLSGWIEHAATSGFAPILLPVGQDLPLVPKDKAVAETFAGVHRTLVWLFAAAITLHVAGALKHHLIDRDPTLRRMLPGRSGAPPAPSQSAGWAPLLAATAVLSITVSVAVFRADTEPATQSSSASGEWIVTGGSLSIGVTQLGRRLEGRFSDWSADIRFEEPTAPGPAGHVSVRIGTASLDLGAVTAQALGPDFLDATRFPAATFEADIALSPTGYVATGPLTLRDQSLTVTLPFDLQLDGDTATMSGRLTIDRLDYGIGASLPDEGTLAFPVDVSVTLTANHAGE